MKIKDTTLINDMLVFLAKDSDKVVGRVDFLAKTRMGVRVDDTIQLSFDVVDRDDSLTLGDTVSIAVGTGEIQIVESAFKEDKSETKRKKEPSSAGCSSKISLTAERL
ncbi:MAG: hypothetical protein CL678_16015 [Bdellovibrionaceae bacterium]|nr:hypothetical protein [Pseudobdellovibrionaceae bacterium]|tara:strand:+ start:159 stop:482 length:324 start_codon:yes stop_codon:yes gene_type:complete